MSELQYLINISVNISAFVIALNSLLGCIISRNVESKTRTFFTVFFSILALYAFFSTLSHISTEHLANPELTKFFIFMHSLLSSILMPMLTI